MLGEKRIETTLFGESVTLDFGLRFSGRLRKLYPNYEEILDSEDPAQQFVIIVKSALPERFDSKTEDDIIKEIDSLGDEGAELLNRCMNGFRAALGFLAIALRGAINTAEAVEKGKRKGK